MTSCVTHKNMAHKPVTLTSRSHLLHRVDLHDIVLEFARCKKLINNLELLDGQGMKIHLLNGDNVTLFHQASKLCNWQPVLFVTFALALALSLLPFAFASFFTFAEVTFAKTAVSHVDRRSMRWAQRP